VVEDGEGSFKILDPNTILSMHAIKVRKIRVTDVAFPSNFTSSAFRISLLIIDFRRKIFNHLTGTPNGC